MSLSLADRWRVTSVRLVCCRAEVMLGSGACCAVVLHVGLDCDAMRGCEASRATGWEVNANGRLGPRSVELAQLSDPSELAHAAATLNLELMRWRLLPDLDVETRNARVFVQKRKHYVHTRQTHLPHTFFLRVFCEGSSVWREGVRERARACPQVVVFSVRV